MVRETGCWPTNGSGLLVGTYYYAENMVLMAVKIGKLDEKVLFK